MTLLCGKEKEENQELIQKQSDCVQLCASQEKKEKKKLKQRLKQKQRDCMQP